MDVYDLIYFLSSKYSVSEEKLRKHIKIMSEIVDVESRSSFYDSQRTDVFGHKEFGASDSSRGKKRFSEWGKPAELHIPIYGNPTVRLKLGNNYRRYEYEKFITIFPEKILFVVPLYGPFEYSGGNSEIQRAIKKFVVDFGNRVGRSVIVFDYWVQEEFDYEQYMEQEREIIHNFDIASKKLPSILISNRSPYAWDDTDEARKMVLLSFRNFKVSELGTRLTEISRDLRSLELPSKWGHSWKRLIYWCESKGIISNLIGIAGL